MWCLSHVLTLEQNFLIRYDSTIVCIYLKVFQQNFWCLHLPSQLTESVSFFSSDIISAPLSVSLPAGTLIIQILTCLPMSQFSQTLVIFSFLFICSSGGTILTHTLLIFKTLTVLLFSYEHFRCNTSQPLISVGVKYYFLFQTLLYCFDAMTGVFHWQLNS